MRRFALATAALLLSTGMAFAQPVHPRYMRAIDAALPGAKLTSAQRAEVVSLRNEGERMHNAGNHARADVVLKQAMGILKVR